MTAELCCTLLVHSCYDSSGMCPLQLVILRENKAQKEHAIRLLLEAYPAAVRTPRLQTNEVPLHNAAWASALGYINAASARLVFDAYPGALSISTTDGLFPLDYFGVFVEGRDGSQPELIASGKLDECLLDMLRAYPDAARPRMVAAALHCFLARAAKCHYSDHTISAIAAADPAALVWVTYYLSTQSCTQADSSTYDSEEPDGAAPLELSRPVLLEIAGLTVKFARWVEPDERACWDTVSWPTRVICVMNLVVDLLVSGDHSKSPFPHAFAPAQWTSFLQQYGDAYITHVEALLDKHIQHIDVPDMQWTRWVEWPCKWRSRSAGRRCSLACFF